MNKYWSNLDTFFEHWSYILVASVYQRHCVTDFMNPSLLPIAGVKINSFSNGKVRTYEISWGSGPMHGKVEYVSQIEIYELQFNFMSYELNLKTTGSNLWVTSLNPGFTCSNLQVMSSYVQVTGSKARVINLKSRDARLKAQVGKLKAWVKVMKP